MTNERRAKGGRFWGCLIWGIGLTPVVLMLLIWVGVWVGVVPMRIPNFDGARPDVPPEPLNLPWVSGALGWGFLLACVGLTALTFWLERGRERRLEPLVLVAVCLAALGHAEAIYGAQAIAFSGAWPVNLVEVAVWLLLAAAGVGAVAWVRMFLSKDPVRGRVLATGALLCSLGTAWIVHRFLVDCWQSPITGDGIELAVVRDSSCDGRDLGGAHPVVVVRADGTTSPDSILALTGAAHREEDAPSQAISIRADRRASWSAVRQVLEQAFEAGISRVNLLSRWEQPEATTSIVIYLALHGDPPNSNPSLPTPKILRVDANGVLSFEGELLTEPSSLPDRLARLYREVSETGVIWIDPAEEARWEEVANALSAVGLVFREAFLGQTPIAVWG